MLGAPWPGSWSSSSRPARTTPTRRWWRQTSPASGDFSTRLSRSRGRMSSGTKLKSSRTIQWDLKTWEKNLKNLFSTDSKPFWPPISVFSTTFWYQDDARQTCSCKAQWGSCNKLRMQVGLLKTKTQKHTLSYLWSLQWTNLDYPCQGQHDVPRPHRAASGAFKQIVRIFWRKDTQDYVRVRRYNTDVPLVLMNSFLTDEDTEKIIRKYSSFQVTIKTFKQSCFPRITRDTLMPAPRWAMENFIALAVSL